MRHEIVFIDNIIEPSYWQNNKSTRFNSLTTTLASTNDYHKLLGKITRCLTMGHIHGAFLNPISNTDITHRQFPDKIFSNSTWLITKENLTIIEDYKSDEKTSRFNFTDTYGIFEEITNEVSPRELIPRIIQSRPLNLRLFDSQSRLILYTRRHDVGMCYTSNPSNQELALFDRCTSIFSIHDQRSIGTDVPDSQPNRFVTKAPIIPNTTYMSKIQEAGLTSYFRVLNISEIVPLK